MNALLLQPSLAWVMSAGHRDSKYNTMEEVWRMYLHYIERDTDRRRDNHAYARNLISRIADSLDSETNKHGSHHPDDEHADECSYHFCTRQTKTWACWWVLLSLLHIANKDTSTLMSAPITSAHGKQRHEHNDECSYHFCTLQTKTWACWWVLLSLLHTANKDMSTLMSAPITSAHAKQTHQTFH